jgi:dihydropteroate synthase
MINGFNWGQRTYLMGVLNITPDSFSDGGQFNSLEKAIAQGLHLVNHGADILDIGGQSTRPGAEQVSLEEEIARVIPVIAALRQRGITHPISVDTTRAEVAARAIAAGATMINDISGATFDPTMLATVARLDIPIVLMHLRGTPATMQTLTDYQDVVAEVGKFLSQRLQAALTAGIKRENLLIDPGIGFAKTAEQNIILLRHLSRLRSLGVPILVGVSRKSFIGKILDRPDPKARGWGTAAATCGAIAGGADVIRAHDFPEMWDVARVADTLWR